MFPRNITRITTSVLKNSPYTFDVLWSKSNYMLVEMIPKPPPPGKIPDYDMEAQVHKNVKEVFEIINSDNKINPCHIFIICNKNTDAIELTFNEKEIFKHNPKDSKIHFSYINLLEKHKVDTFFHNLSRYIFDNSIIKKTSLIPLNIKDNTIPEKKTI